jgi:hypothetical protein
LCRCTCSSVGLCVVLEWLMSGRRLGANGRGKRVEKCSKVYCGRRALHSSERAGVVSFLSPRLSLIVGCNHPVEDSRRTP